MEGNCTTVSLSDTIRVTVYIPVPSQVDFADSRECCDANGYKKVNLFRDERTSAKLTVLQGNL